MDLHNTLTNQISRIIPLKDNIISIYSCGPTVYDSAHIGNLSSYIYADTLHRTLEASGLNVTHIMNITDVDDKTIKKSRELNHKQEPMEALSSLTKEYAGTFFEDMKDIGIDINSYDFVKATDHIEHMQIIINNLLTAGFAYITEDGVYFSIQKYIDSGKKYGQLLNLTNINNGKARIDNDEYDKDSAIDFALWKKRKGDEPFWKFEIKGEKLDGRPGWHIECSAMSASALGIPFDIHTGGIDLIFPHHENEIAQSTANSKNQIMATTFFHNEHLLVGGKKMSKSLDNFFTLLDIKNKNIDVLSFRVFVLQSHYRSQSNFSWENLLSAQIILQDIRNWADLRFQNLESKELKKDYEQALPKIFKSVSNDLNTPEALSILISLIKKTGEIGADSQAISDSLVVIEKLFGLNLLNRQDITQFQKETIKQRALARNNQDWELSDTIREELYNSGIKIRDTEQGQIWSRTNT